MHLSRSRRRWCWGRVLSLVLTLILADCAEVLGAEAQSTTYTFHLHGGHFFGPGPIVPDTALPDGRLTHIRFDFRTWQGFCEFANDGRSGSHLSDQQTRINQNIDAGQLLVGGGTSPILLAAVDGGPHHGREEYTLDEQYRLVWRVDIALDSGFPEGIIRLNDFILSTGVARIARSQQSDRGEPGGYDQAGTLLSGTYIAGRLGDFDQDGFLDGVLVAAPTVPMEADMLPGAPVGNQRGFRTDLPISPGISLELILRGLSQLRQPIDTLIAEGDTRQLANLAGDILERMQAAHLNLERTAGDPGWGGAHARREAQLLAESFQRTETAVQRLGQQLRDAASQSKGARLQESSRAAFEALDKTVLQVADLNDHSAATLPRAAQSLGDHPERTIAAAGPSAHSGDTNTH
jgi:hypothetical protein